MIDDLNQRRARISDIQTRMGAQVVRAEAPLGSMFGYVGALRSLSQGRATFTMQFGRYAAVPDSVAAEIIKQ
ncbi:Elongation factor G [compost metagenome]